MDNISITKHPLKHIPELKVDPGLLKVKFAKSCSILKCSGSCCWGGVWADVAEQENILNHAELILRSMETGMEKNPDAWFDGEYISDVDFVSGKAVGTEVKESGCVFLTRAGLCILQKIEMEQKNPALKLKPFYCKAFPIAIKNSIVIYDNYMESDQPQCCSADPDGELDIFDVCAEELKLILGREGLEELREKSKIIPGDSP